MERRFRNAITRAVWTAGLLAVSVAMPFPVALTDGLIGGIPV